MVRLSAKTSGTLYGPEMRTIRRRVSYRAAPPLRDASSNPQMYSAMPISEMAAPAAADHAPGDEEQSDRQEDGVDQHGSQTSAVPDRHRRQQDPRAEGQAQAADGDRKPPGPGAAQCRRRARQHGGQHGGPDPDAVEGHQGLPARDAHPGERNHTARDPQQQRRQEQPLEEERQDDHAGHAEHQRTEYVAVSAYWPAEQERPRERGQPSEPPVHPTPPSGPSAAPLERPGRDRAPVVSQTSLTPEVVSRDQLAGNPSAVRRFASRGSTGIPRPSAADSTARQVVSVDHNAGRKSQAGDGSRPWHRSTSARISSAWPLAARR